MCPSGLVPSQARQVTSKSDNSERFFAPITYKRISERSKNLSKIKQNGIELLGALKWENRIFRYV